jgi:hypothetical protein
MTEEADPIVLEVDEQPPKKPKRVMSDAQREGLAKGRAALAAKRAAAKSIQIVPIAKSDDAAPEPAPHNDDDTKKPSKLAKPKVPPPPPEPSPPVPDVVETPQPVPPAPAKAKRTKSEQKTIKAIQSLPKKQAQAVEKDQLKYMTKETKAQLQQARRLRDAAEAREMSLNSIIEQKVAREVANYKRQEKLKKAAELLQQEAAKPPPPVPEPRVHYEDSEEEEEDNGDNGDNGETQETPARSVTFQQPAQQPAQQPPPRNAVLHGRAWANDPYLAKMMAGMR